MYAAATIAEPPAKPARAPCCPSCGQPMRLVKAAPRLGALPELRTYECKACGVTYSEAAEPGAAMAARQFTALTPR